MTAAMPTVVGDLIETFTGHAHRPKPAIIHNGHVIDYPSLAERVRALAHALGPSPGTVGVFTSRTPETVIALLGVLAAGGTYCPIDPAFPAARREAMLTAAGCRTALITDPGQQPPQHIPALTVAEQDTAPVRLPAVDRADAAYVLFTSGSTGAPKPVVTPREGLSVTVAALNELFELTEQDKVLQFASLNWDTCFEEILPALTTGASVVCDAAAHTGSFPKLLRLIAERGITVLDLPTAFWHELVHHLNDGDDRLPECLRLLVIGGEAVSPARLADWHRLGTADIRLLNTYGCTETTMITHAAELNAELGADGGPAPIGLPLPHVLAAIADDGELLIGGPAVATGYLGAPQATAARFVERDGERFFHTGDRVEARTDGSLLHRGRLDHELKIRGVRVDPAEVEALVGRHREVKEVAVLGVAAAGRTQLVAYLVAAPGTEPVALRRRLLAELRDQVPAHLIPGRIQVVEALAYTASGKVDRAATHRRYMPAGAGRSTDER